MCRKTSSQTRMSSSSTLNPYAAPFVSSIKTPAPAPFKAQLYLQYPPPRRSLVCFRHPQQQLVRFHYCYVPPPTLKLEGVSQDKNEVKRRKYSRKFRPSTSNSRFVMVPNKKEWTPKRVSVVKLDESSPLPPVSPHDGKTSIMMRNIPNQLRRNDLLKFLDKYSREHDLEYDFAYLPIDFRRHNNKGYAFINFTKPQDAMMFKELLDGYKWGEFRLGKTYFSAKTCEITWAKIQGKDGFVSHFKNSNFLCYCKEYLPVELSPPSKGSAFLSTLTTVGRYLGSSSSAN